MKTNFQTCAPDVETPKIGIKTIYLADRHKKSMVNLCTSLYSCMFESEMATELKVSCCGTVLAEYAVLSGIPVDDIARAFQKSYQHFEEKKRLRTRKEK